VRVGDRWKDAADISVGDVVRPVGQPDFATVVNKIEGVHGDVILSVTYRDEDWNVYDLPVLAPHERVETDPGLSAKPD
jgi:hypothetical protein